MNKIIYTVLLTIFSFSFAIPAFASISLQGSKSASWIPAGLYEYNNDKRPYHDIQYDSTPNHSIYTQIDTSPTYFLTGTGNNYNPFGTPRIPMNDLEFWGIEKGQSALYDSDYDFVLTSPVTPVFIGGHIFNNDVREIGVTSGGVDRSLFTMNGINTLVVVNDTIEPGTWKWYVITKDGKRKEANQSVVAPFINSRTGEVYVGINSFNFWAFAGIFLRLDPVL
jgi:hypothetical protein